MVVASIASGWGPSIQTDPVDHREINARVWKLFAGIKGQPGAPRQNPITLGRFVLGLDPISDQMELARRRLAAEVHFQSYAPPDCLPLPLSYIAREDRKAASALGRIVGLFARSLDYWCYDYLLHPRLEVYASGLMALPSIAVALINRDPSLAIRFPPKPLQHLGASSYYENEQLREISKLRPLVV